MRNKSDSFGFSIGENFIVWLERLLTLTCGMCDWVLQSTACTLSIEARANNEITTIQNKQINKGITA